MHAVSNTCRNAPTRPGATTAIITTTVVQVYHGACTPRTRVVCRDTGSGMCRRAPSFDKRRQPAECRPVRSQNPPPPPNPAAPARIRVPLRQRTHAAASAQHDESTLTTRAAAPLLARATSVDASSWCGVRAVDGHTTSKGPIKTSCERTICKLFQFQQRVRSSCVTHKKRPQRVCSRPQTGRHTHTTSNTQHTTHSPSSALVAHHGLLRLENRLIACLLRLARGLGLGRIGLGVHVGGCLLQHVAQRPRVLHL